MITGGRRKDGKGGGESRFGRGQMFEEVEGRGREK